MLQLTCDERVDKVVPSSSEMSSRDPAESLGREELDTDPLVQVASSHVRSGEAVNSAIRTERRTGLCAGNHHRESRNYVGESSHSGRL